MSGPEIQSIQPSIGIAGGEIAIGCRNFQPGLPHSSKVLFGSTEAAVSSASDSRVIAKIPESAKSLGVSLRVGEEESAGFPFTLGAVLASGVHAVTNPVIAPDGAIVTTISGRRGQRLAKPIVKVSRSGEIIHYDCDVLNPTGLAFGPDGQLYLTNRAEGTVLRFRDFETLETVSEDLGVPCGITFDSHGTLFVGDRSGKIFRLDLQGGKEEYLVLEPSVSAYHLMIDDRDRLYVTGPTLSSRDVLYRATGPGTVEVVVGGLGRPQGMAWTTRGTILLAATHSGRKGIFEIDPETGALEHYIAAPTLVGLALSGSDILLADGTTVYTIQFGGSPGSVV